MESLFELETQLIIVNELKLINPIELDVTFSLIQKEAKMMNSLIQKIKNS